ncbi:MAG: hypothetical protein R2735_05380 [Microthrixaceae bacterium]
MQSPLIRGWTIVPPGPTDGRLYISPQPEISPTTLVNATTDNVWGSAPNIDPHYGGVLYEGTAYQINSDPRPDLKDGNQPLRMWVADPNDGRTERPAIIFYHGGGFAMGVNSMASDGSMAYALSLCKPGLCRHLRRVPDRHSPLRRTATEWNEAVTVSVGTGQQRPR